MCIPKAGKMEREKKTIGEKFVRALTYKVMIPENAFTRVLLYISFCCCLQFWVVGFVGVFRGYSVQGDLSFYIMIGAAVFVIFLLGSLSSRHMITRNFTLLTLVCSSILILPKGRYLKRGDDYYEQGQYQKALEEFNKETQTWYLRLTYNPHEGRAMVQMAKTYCQLEDFDKARDIYRLTIDRYPGFYGDRAQKYLEQLENGLKIATKYEDWVSGKKGFPYDLADERLKSYDWKPEQMEPFILYDVALAYKIDLKCHIKALEVYKKIVDMDIDEEQRKIAGEQLEKLKAIITK